MSTNKNTLLEGPYHYCSDDCVRYFGSEYLRYDEECWAPVRDDLIRALTEQHGARFIAFSEEFKAQTLVEKAFLGCISRPLFCRIFATFKPGRDFFRDYFLNRLIFNPSPFSVANQELIEFIYVTADRGATIASSNKIVLKGFFVLRSILGKLETDNYLYLNAGRFAGVELKNIAIVKQFGDELMLPVSINPTRGLEVMASFHGGHWFRNYNKVSYDPEDSPQDATDNVYKEFTSLAEQFFSSVGFVPFAYFSFVPGGDLKVPNRYNYPEELRHPHHDIPGINAPDSYSTPTVLLHLLHVYTILFKVTFIDGFGYANRGHYLEHLGSAEGFRTNIYSILSALSNQFPKNLSVLDVEFLIAKQLNNVIEAIFLDSDAILKNRSQFKNKWLFSPGVPTFDRLNLPKK